MKMRANSNLQNQINYQDKSNFENNIDLKKNRNKKFINVDGNTAASMIAYFLSEVAEIYPITPSSAMAENCDDWAERGKTNIFGNRLLIREMQSEAGAAGALHGSLSTGALSTTFTASQGLLLMLPNMFKIAGELLPCVFHVSARAIATHALSIFGDHSDVMAARTTGFNMLCSGSVQEAHDLALVAHIASLESSLPILHFFDGFRTSHEVQKIESIDEEEIKKIFPFEKVCEFKERALNPISPCQKGTAQNPDVFFQNREAANLHYENVFAHIENAMQKVEKITGRAYKPFEFFGSPTAENVLIMMGSGAETAEETIEFLNNTQGNKFGLIKVRLFRPFNASALVEALPKSVKNIAVLDRTKECGAIGEPLFLDVVAALQKQKILCQCFKLKQKSQQQKDKKCDFNSNINIQNLDKNNIKELSFSDCEKSENCELEHLESLKNAFETGGEMPKIIGGRYGLGSKEFTPSCVLAVFENLQKEQPIHGFTVGICDDVSFLSLPLNTAFELPQKGVRSMKFYGLGSDGTVSANKNSIKIIGELTPFHTQGFFEYDSKKSGSITISHLRISEKPIKSTYVITSPEFIAIHNYSFVAKYTLIDNLREGGTVLLNTVLNAEELSRELPKHFAKVLQQKKAKLFIINANKIAEECGLGNKINVIMQSAFFEIAQIIPSEEIAENLKNAASKTYGHKGKTILEANFAAIERGMQEIFEVDVFNLKGVQHLESKACTNAYFKNFIEPINRLEGNKLPVSAFDADGTVPTNTTQFEKRGIAQKCPKWLKENCIQCGFCVMACPHAALRSHLVNSQTLAKSSKLQKLAPLTVPAFGSKETSFKLQLSPLDCTGCGVCESVCPAKNKALKMVLATEILDAERENLETTKTLINEKNPYALNSPKGLQFEAPYFEFNYACPGCGETPYIKLATTLFGENMLIANATGCSSIYGGSAPACPFTKNAEGCGPAWANSLFEDNAEFGFGFKLGINSAKIAIKNNIEKLLKQNNNGVEILSSELKDELINWLQNPNKLSNSQANYLIKNLESFKNLIERNKDKANLSKELIKDKNKNAIAENLFLDGEICKNNCQNLVQNILNNKGFLGKKSVWIIGGDGWAYDIGFGGLDHVLASNEDVNMLVLDTEVYSNTGGQSSKSTPKGAFAKFAIGGKPTAKKDLGAIAMNYPGAYVASVSMGADMMQCIKAFKEAEAHNGPSLIIAYAPCINHGFDMSNSFLEMKRAVDSGYWFLYRNNPNTLPHFYLDSREPTLNYEEFLIGETRYSAIIKKSPDVAKALFAQSKAEAQQRYDRLKQKLKQNIN